MPTVQQVANFLGDAGITPMKRGLKVLFSMWLSKGQTTMQGLPR